MQFKVTILVLALAGCSALVNGNQILNAYADHFQLDSSVQTLFPVVVGDLNDYLEQISQCYEPELVGQTVNLFDREASIKSIVGQYYQAFPHKSITKHSIANLISSIRQITSACLQSGESQSIRYGFTELSDMSDAQIEALSGALPMNSTLKSIGNVKFYDGSDSECQQSGAPEPASFDWRQHGAVTSVKNQGQCGSCWAFAVTASIEGAYLVKGKTSNTNFALSEQQIVDCAKSYGCSGGYSYTGFEYVKNHGLTSYANYPYRGSDNGCTGRRYTPAATISDYCVRSRFRYSSDFHAEALDDSDIVQSLVNNGPLYILVNAATAWTRNYRGGVVTGGCNTQTNHAVLLVGYTSDAWIIKNSWGGSWGESGYFRLARGRDLCGINTEIAWPLL